MTTELQKPAEGILRVNREEQAWDHFLVACDCGIHDHSIDANISIDRDEEDKNWIYVNVEFFVTMYTPFLGYGWDAFKKRFTRSMKYLFTGIIELEHSITMRDEVAKNFAAALAGSIEEKQLRIEMKRKDK